MKKYLLTGLLAFTVCFLPASLPAQEAQPAAVEVVDTLNTYEIGGATFYIIAEKMDSLYKNVRVVAAQVKAENPEKPIDWVLIFVKLLTSGVLASLISQGVKIFNDLKQLVSKLPRGEWIVFVVSTLLGAGWLYLETKFVGFEFMALFYKTAGVFMVAIIAWRAGVNRLFQKKETPPAATP